MFRRIILAGVIASLIPLSGYTDVRSNASSPLRSYAQWRPRFEVPNAIMADAVKAAITYWGESVFQKSNNDYYVPCHTLTIKATIPDGGDVLAYSTYQPFNSDNCVLNFNEHLADPGYAAANWTPFCVLMLHEYGHALGLRHSHDPTSIMWPEAGGPTDVRAVPYVCQSVDHADGKAW